MKRPVVWSRAALDELKTQAAYVSRDNRKAARQVAARIRGAGSGLRDFATGHPGRVAGTYEKSVSGLPYVLAYAIDREGQSEKIIILHVIHTARDWRASDWPRE